MCSQVRPMRSRAPGAKFSTSTSQCLINRSRSSLPLGCLESMVIERLLPFSMVKYRLSAPLTSRSWPRVMSPTPGRSTLMTSAPMKASNCVQVGPDCTCVKSRMRTPSSALPACPQGFDDGRGRPFPLADLAGSFCAATFTVFFAGFLADLTVVLADFLAGASDLFARSFDFAFVRVAIGLLHYFLR